MSESTREKAYVVRYRIVNVAEAIVYADTAKEAREKFDAGDVAYQGTTGEDYRLRGVTVRRAPLEDGHAA